MHVLGVLRPSQAPNTEWKLCNIFLVVPGHPGALGTQEILVQRYLGMHCIRFVQCMPRHKHFTAAGLKG